MNVERLLVKGRRAMQGLMGDACTVTRPGGRGPFNEDTGQYDPAPSTVVYSGPCVFKAQNVVPRDAEAGERTVTVAHSVVDLPFEDAPEPVRKGDVVTMTAVADYGDDWLVGRPFTVTAVDLSSLSVARRLSVEAQT